VKCRWDVLECAKTFPESEPRGGPIILPLTEILTVPVSQSSHMMVTVMLKTCQQGLNFFLFFISSSTHCLLMSLLAGLNDEIVDYAKSMPEHNVAEDLNFEVWGKGLCEKIVSFEFSFVVSGLTHIVQAEYDDLALDLGEECDPAVQDIIIKVVKLFKLLAHCEWLEWGGELLFSELQDEVACEEREAAEAKAWAEAEAAEAKHLEDEEQARQDAAAAKAAKLQGQKAALLVAHSAALAGFHAKTLSKEDLQLRNTELAAEAKAIEREEVEGEVEKEEDEEEEANDLPVVQVAKQKAEAFEEDEEEVDQLEEDRVDAKG
jgi:hypothetical protein